MPPTAQSIAPPLDRATELAMARTLASYERTMMAWIRTAISLITFGFSIYKFFQLELPARPERTHLIGPRGFAMILVGIGLFALLLAIIEYRMDVRSLVVEYGQRRRPLAPLLAGLVAMLGLVALALMIFRP